MKVIKLMGALYIIMVLILNAGCKKYLDKKPDKKLVVPSSIADLQAMLDASNTMNIYSWGLGESSADDYYLTEKDWASLYAESDKEAYIWGDEIVGAYPNTWSLIYNSMYVTNVVLDNIDNVALNNSTEIERSNVKGAALFFRAFECFRMATTFANSYDDKTADKDLGIPLRLSADFNEKSTRGTLKETYNQIINDLLAAIKLLPKYPDHVLRPSKGAAYGLLARVYLSMRDYEAAGKYADSCSKLNDELINFNDLTPSINYPISIFNQETVFYATGGTSNTINSKAKIDSNLYKSYDNNDLRKLIFFKENQDGSHGFFGGYTGSGALFTGIASDEQYLIRAECLARSNKVSEAMEVLNKLLITRWKSGTFVPYQTDDENESISIILQERRKELLMRDLRWQEIKRLNKEGEGISLKRVLGDKTFELPANSPKFALPLPASIIELTGMQQNPR